MFKRFSVLVLVGLLAGSGLFATNYKSVPKPVIEFYRDTMALFTSLARELKAAREPKAVARAFNQATKVATDQKLAERYKNISKQYPEFFADNPEDNGNWVPPTDWVKISDEFNQQMMEYGNNTGNLGSSMGSPEVVAAMDRFGALMETLSSGE